MKRSLRGLVAAVAVASVMVVGAPAANADEVAGPEDAAGCTSVLLGETSGWVSTRLPSDPVSVEYVPPGTVHIDADYPLGIVTNIAGDVVAWVICVA